MAFVQARKKNPRVPRSHPPAKLNGTNKAANGKGVAPAARPRQALTMQRVYRKKLNRTLSTKEVYTVTWEVFMVT